MASKTIEDYRKELNYQERFNVIIAEGLSMAVDSPKHGLYERLDGFVKGLGKSLFLPGRDLDYDCGNGQINLMLLEHIIVPSAEVVLCFSQQYRMGIISEVRFPHDPAGFILRTARILEIPTKHFVPEIVQADTAFDLTQYSDLEDGFEKAKEFLEKFYGHE